MAVYDDELSDLALRRQQRVGESGRKETAREIMLMRSWTDATRQMSKISLHKLEALDLILRHTPTRNESFQIQCALPSTDSPDHLSESIHALSLAPDMKTIRIYDHPVISSALFMPSRPVKIALHWPHLEELRVFFDAKTPDGE